MIKNKAFTFLIFSTILLNFSINNSAFATESDGATNKYPDYACEFVGRDTCENFNRKIFVFNTKLNKYVIRPVNIAWASVMPQYGIDRIQSFYTNLKYPIRLASCLLQKDFKASGTETVRFLTNTTLGVVGLYDPALTRFKIEPCDEDLEQALAYYNVKKGPYIVLPVISPGNVREVAGQVLDLPLNPSAYIMGPVSLVSTGVSLVNETTSMQPLLKAISSDYADPYQVTKQLCGVEQYIKNANLDRKEVLAEKAASQKIFKISNVSDNSAANPNLKADIKLNNYNPQGPLVDSMRTMFFDNQNLNDSIWSEMSVWNKTFKKQIKTSSVNVDFMHPNYKYRYILQKNKTAPVAIIYPSIGEGIMSDESVMQAKILYDEGYSVVIEGSTFQWEFIKSMPDNYRPGLPSRDAYYSRIVTSMIINQLQGKYACKFNKKILVGNSFGALTALFVAAQENDTSLGKNTLGISNYIAINPPIEIFYALKKLDKFSQEWKNDPSDIKLRAAITAQKVVQVSQKLSDKKSPNREDTKTQILPFTDDEAKLAIGFTMKQKLSDVVFTIEKGSTSKKSDIYDSINNMSFYDYAQKYLINNQDKSVEQLSYDSSLYSLASFLQKNKNYKIYHSLDDCFVNLEQLTWLKKQTGNKSIFFSNGSHLGFLYRKEFLKEFKNDIKVRESL